MNLTQYLPLVRHLLQIVAGILIAKGVFSEQEANNLVQLMIDASGPLLAVATIVWMQRDKKKQPAPPAAPPAAAAAFVLGILLLGSGCGSILPGNDPVVVNAERTTATATEAFDTFLKWEFQNREVLAAIPEIRRSADRIRADGQAWLSTARTLTKAYKSNRTAENKASLETAIEIMKAATREAQAYLLQTSK